MGFAVIVPPTIEPITTDEGIAHLRVGSGNTEPAPDAPTVALISPAVAGNVDNGAHRYRVTFVTADGETEGGTISSAVTVADKTTNGKVTVSNLPIGGPLVTSRKIYRTTAGGTSYLLLTTISNNTTTSYTDNTADSSLGASAPTSNTTGDTEIASLITAARQYCETVLNRAILTQTIRYTLDHFPGQCGGVCWWCRNHCRGFDSCDRTYDVINLPRPNLLAVDTVEYVATDGTTTLLDEDDDYIVDTENLPGRIYLPYGVCWPATRWQRNAVTITYTAGYGPLRSDVPDTVRSAVKLVLSDLYENRDAKLSGIVTPNQTVEALLYAERFMEAA